MRIKLLLISLVILGAINVNAQIAAWDFSGNSGTAATFAATTWNSNLSSTASVKNITRGAGAAASSAGNSFRTTGFKNDGISTANTDYFQVTLTAATGYKVSLSTINANFGGTATYYVSPGVTSQFAYSLDGSSFTLIGSAVQSTSLTMSQISLSSITALQNVAAGTTITLRYYASGQTSTGGWGFLSAASAGTNGLAIGGTVDLAASAPPVLTAAAGATVDAAFDVTLTDVSAWRTGISAITVNGTTLAGAAYSTGTASKITFTPSASGLLQSSGSKTIIITSSGYTADTVIQSIGAGAVSSSTSTATISAALALNTTKTVTATAKDQYNNLVSGYVFKFIPTITNNSGTTAETYTINGSAYTSTQTAQSLTATNGSGVVTFNITIPVVVDGGDGVSVQVKLNNGTTNVGSAFAFSQPTTPALTISHAGLTEVNLSGAQVSLSLTNETFADGTLSSGNFTLNNAPSGTSIGSVTYNSSTSATVTLIFNGTDFDANVTNFSITIAGAELTSGSPVTSNTLTITATVEVAPTVTTASIGSFSATTASGGGNVTSDGGGTASAAVTVRGVVWGTSAGVTLATGTASSDGTGTGAFTSSITGLSPNTKYYVNAYATNSVGTSYGTETNFTTSGLTAPTANYGSNFSTTGFTANWASVIGATSYRFDVATSSAFSSTTSLINENFSKVLSGSIGSPSSTDGSGNLDTLTVATGWTGSRIYSAGGALKFGTASALGYIVTPSLDLSSGTSTLKFDLQTYGSDAKVVQVFLSTDGGSTFPTQIGTDITPTSSMVTQTLSVTGGSATSKIKITASAAASNRFYIDNVIITTSTTQTLPGYSDLTVNGTSQAVTGLSANTNYYYRVRAYSATSTSANSNISLLKTPSIVSAPTVGTGTSVSVPVTGTSGISNITFGTVSAGGTLNVTRYADTASNTSSIPLANKSWYRWIIEPSAGFTYTGGYVLTFKRSDIYGILELNEGDNTTVKIYKRSTPGSGSFTDEGYLTYHRNGTDGDVSDDYLVSGTITDGFSEFVIASDGAELPVELTTFSLSSNGRNIQLTWKTATEVNSAKFIVERSKASANTWTNVVDIKASGKSNSPKTYSFTDRNLSTGSYNYRLKMIDNDGTYEYSPVIEGAVGVPTEFSVAQNYPNPFNPSTKISFDLPRDAKVTLELFSITGAKVANLMNESKSAGYHDFTLNMNAYNLPSGVYMYKLSGNEALSGKQFSQVKKLVYLK